MVPEAGLEPASPYGQWILNPSCLPISSLGRICPIPARLGRTYGRVARMRSPEEVDQVRRLFAVGHNKHGCEVAMAGVLPTKVVVGRREGRVEVYSYSKHWP